MQIEAKGPTHWLEEFAAYLRHELERSGYSQGPRVGQLEAGACWTFLKDELILTLELEEKSDGIANLQLECEAEIPRLDEMWDNALIALGQDVLKRIRGMARNSKKVEQALI